MAWFRKRKLRGDGEFLIATSKLYSHSCLHQNDSVPVYENLQQFFFSLAFKLDVISLCCFISIPAFVFPGRDFVANNFFPNHRTAAGNYQSFI